MRLQTLQKRHFMNLAGVAELVDAPDLKSVDCKVVRVRVPLSAPGPVAQWLEQGTHNPLVAGSNPAGPTIL